jgi:hypothetical protein
MVVALLVVLTLAAQVALTTPGSPAWGTEILLPMVWIVGPAMRLHGPRWTYLALALGVGWDLVLREVVIGPGGIAWSATALVAFATAGIVADRSPRAWFALGAGGSLVFLSVRYLTLLPLGLATPVPWPTLVRSPLLTGAWCALVGLLLALDLPARYRRWRARKLR